MGSVWTIFFGSDWANLGNMFHLHVMHFGPTWGWYNLLLRIYYINWFDHFLYLWWCQKCVWVIMHIFTSVVKIFVLQFIDWYGNSTSLLNQILYYSHLASHHSVDTPPSSATNTFTLYQNFQPLIQSIHQPYKKIH